MGPLYQSWASPSVTRSLASLLLPCALVAACARAEPTTERPAANGANAANGVSLSHAEISASNGAANVATAGMGSPSLTAAGASPSPCPDGMVLVEGEYCPEVEQLCEKWMDPPGTKYAQFRCAKYRNPSTCKSARKHVRYCIDRTERREESSNRPKNFVSFDQARALCKDSGARVCNESEWQFACEGEEMRPYPYGFERSSTVCNVDKLDHLMSHGRLADHRRDVGEDPRCVSPFGVQDLSGNVEEWVAADGKGKSGWKQVLKGSYWIPSRHACRQFQIGHGPEYGGRETGTRCCKDAD